METYVIHVTKECNCDCVYCYENDKTSKYTFKEIKEYVDKLLLYRTSNEFIIEFLGGEPLMAWDLIKQTYEYLESIDGIRIPNYVITTNGTIMNEEIAIYLSENDKIRFAASIDGHIYANQLRVFKGSRKNTYQTVLNNLELLRKYNVTTSIHMVTHPYNIAMLSDSIDVLYKQGIRSIGIGTVENTMLIDEDYCERFVSECDIVSKRIISGIYKDLYIGEFEGVKPKEDMRTYIRDESGKVVGETYGRSGKDISYAEKDYKIQRCMESTRISDMIYDIRYRVYKQHQENKRKVVIQ